MSPIPFFASWISWFTDWKNPLSRPQRQVILEILFKNPIELRVAMLNYQIKQMMLKYI
jgi:hypothetical protein